MSHWSEPYQHGRHDCGSCGRVHFEPFELWCSAERRRLFPANFERWTEEEHKARRAALTWEQQLTVWHHRDVWEAMYDGELNEDQARALLANSEPLPPAYVLGGMIRALVSGMRSGRPRGEQPQPGKQDIPDLTPEREDFLMRIINPVPVPVPDEAAA